MIITPKFVYLRFTASRSFTSWLISTWTNQWPAHVEFVLEPGEYLGADMPSGVAKVNDAYYEKETLNRIEYYKIPVTEEQFITIYDVAHNQIGKDYDIFALIGNVLRQRDWEDDKKWFCSELIAHCFKVADRPLLIKRVNRITPGDLLESPLLVPCYEHDVIKTRW